MQLLVAGSNSLLKQMPSVKALQINALQAEMYALSCHSFTVKSVYNFRRIEYISWVGYGRLLRQKQSENVNCCVHIMNIKSWNEETNTHNNNKKTCCNKNETKCQFQHSEIMVMINTKTLLFLTRQNYV